MYRSTGISINIHSLMCVQLVRSWEWIANSAKHSCMQSCLALWIQRAQSTLQAAATASFNVEVMLHSYSNPTHGYCGGQHCEGLLGQFLLGDCDNAFTFCLRRSTAGNSSCISSTSTSVVHNNDDFTFTSDILNTLGITNPLVFSNLFVTVSYLVDTDVYSLYSCPTCVTCPIIRIPWNC